VHDQLAGGRRFRILAVVDDCTRECLALIADTSISGRRVARELDDVVLRRGRRPETIVSDNVLSWESRVDLEQAGLVAPADVGRQGYFDPSGLHC
jgi:putative transposase